MNKMDFTQILKNINFVSRYQKLCYEHNDFDNSLRGNKKELYDQVLSKFDYKPKYFSKECFYRIVTEDNGYEFGLQLVLKDGLVEPMINIKKGNFWLSPDGRFDFIPQKMGEEFDRKKYNLPKYTSEAELESVLKEIFSIYEDIKKEVIKSQA
jgi:hypothetical protein